MRPSFTDRRLVGHTARKPEHVGHRVLFAGIRIYAALCEQPYGGGKSVIIADPRLDKTATLLRAMGHIIESLGGRYVAPAVWRVTSRMIIKSASVVPTSSAVM